MCLFQKGKIIKKLSIIVCTLLFVVQNVQIKCLRINLMYFAYDILHLDVLNVTVQPMGEFFTSIELQDI